MSDFSILDVMNTIFRTKKAALCFVSQAPLLTVVPGGHLCVCRTAQRHHNELLPLVFYMTFGKLCLPDRINYPLGMIIYYNVWKGTGIAIAP